MSDDSRVTVEQFVVKQRLRPGLGRIAADLRRLADEIEGMQGDLGRVGVGPSGRPTYGHVVARVQSRLHNTVAVLGLDGLTGDAAEADVARAKGE